MKQKYKKLAFFILLLSMLTGCMLLSGCTENTENGSQSSYIVDSDELQDTENQMEFVPGSMKGSKQEETSENEEQGQTEQSRQTVAEENDAEQVKTAGNLEVHFIDVGQGDATLIILGGSFDPIHKGHLNIAQSAYEEFALDEVWFIPAGHSPNKDEKKMTAADIRAEMTALAIYDIPYFKLSRMEIDAEGTSYTYLTLTKLKEACPDIDFFFIMGADSLDYLEKWYHPEIICEKAVILAAVRDDMDLSEVEKKISALKQLFPAEIYPIEGGKTDISSSEIRAALRRGKTDISLIPPKVLAYIQEHHLYEED